MKDSQKEALRLLIRELLAQELAALRKEQVKSQGSSKIKEESVKVESTEELTAFARRICALAQDKQAREDIESGRWVFHLCNVDKMEESRGVRFEKGVVGEKQVASLAEDSCIWAGKRVCFTPLALDEIRRRRIRIEKEN